MFEDAYASVISNRTDVRSVISVCMGIQAYLTEHIAETDKAKAVSTFEKGLNKWQISDGISVSEQLLVFLKETKL